MALVTKNDVTQIFAIQAPEVDLPPTFANYPRGWDTARSNNGKPTIKQFNYIQQRTDQNVLWIHQNGAALPYDATMEYAEGAVVVKDGELQKKQGASWVSVANKGYSLDYFVSGKSYPLHAEIMLENGDIVKSTIANNTTNPNTDMTGWKKKDDADQILDESGGNLQDVLKDRLYANYPDARSLNIIADGTDQTSTIVSMLNSLTAQGVRETLYIPKGVKFNAATVFAAVPLGIVLKISDFTNWGQSGYKNKFEMLFGGDTTADDTQMVIGSGHHPAITLLNTGTSGSAGGDDRVASILHSVGITDINDPMVAQLLQFGTNAAKTKFQLGLRTGWTKDIATKNPKAWVSSNVYAAGDMCLSDGNKVYVTVLGGTSGEIAPNGTGSNINDGGVIWDYFAGRRSRDATTMTLDEDGNFTVYGYTGNTLTQMQMRAGGNRLSMEIDAAGEISIRDYINNNRAILASNVLRGVYNSGVNSFYFSNVTGATPNQGTTAVRVSNATPTTMTNLVLPTGQTYGYAIMTFGDANTTLSHGAGFTLKDAKSVNPPVNGVMVFVKNAGASSSWIEVSRSFAPTSSVTYDPPSISANGGQVTTTATLIGATVGSPCVASFNQYNADIEITAQVSAANTVTVKFKNTSGAAVDLASGTLTVKLI